METEGTPIQLNARKNAQWNQTMTGFLLRYLAEVARKNLKGDRGFKSSIINAACKELNKEFNINYVDAHINNHIKCQKKNWRTIQSLKNMSGIHFDETTKMIVMGEDELRTLLEKNSSSEKWINKPIMWYEEMELVCGNDMANGNRSKSGRAMLGVPHRRSTSPIVDVLHDDDLDDAVNLDDVEVDPMTPVSNPTGVGSKKRKRAVDDLTNYVGDLVKAISTSKVPMSHQFSVTLWDQLKTLVDSYTMRQLRAVHQHFLANESTGSSFIAYDRENRMEMIDDFLLDQAGVGGFL